MRIISLFGALALGASFAASALAQDFKLGTLTVHDPWTRATPKGAPVAGGYAAIGNSGDQADRLIGGSFSASKGFAIHQMAMKDGVMSMAPVEGGLEIPAHGSVTLDPSAIHLMFTGLQRQLKKGEKVEGTLVFEKAGALNVEFDVQAIGARKPAHGDH